MDQIKWHGFTNASKPRLQAWQSLINSSSCQGYCWGVWGAVIFLTVCGLAKVAILPLNFHTKHTLQIYEKLSYEALNRHFCQTAVISCPSVCPKCFRCWIYTELSTLFTVWSAVNGCGCLHSLLLLLRLPVCGGKSKCECKCVSFVCCVVKIVGFIVQLQFYFQTSSNSNLSKLRLMSLPRLRQ